MKLYEATAALNQVEAWIDEHADDIRDAGGELPPALAELLDQAELDFDEKVTRVGFVIRELLAEEKASREEAAFQAARAQARGNAAKALKAYVLFQLTKAGKDEAGTTRLKMRRQASPVKATLVDPELATEACRTTFSERPSATAWKLFLSILRANNIACPVAFEYELDSSEAKALLGNLELAPGQSTIIAGVRFERGEHVRFA